MNDIIGFILRLVAKEALARKKLVISLYVGTALFFAAIAWVWPQVFNSAATIIIEDRNILTPLMKGTAQTSVLTEPLKLAKTMMNSRTTLIEVLHIGGWIDDDTPQAKLIAWLMIFVPEPLFRILARRSFILITEIGTRNGQCWRQKQCQIYLYEKAFQ